jgi:hypothetical protein
VTSPKPRSCEKFLWKTQEKKEILRNPVRNGFSNPKNKFLKTGIGNLDHPLDMLDVFFGKGGRSIFWERALGIVSILLWLW